jgi:transcriptional regulator with XRE-family HTH domain
VLEQEKERIRKTLTRAFGERVMRLREERRLSQEKLAEHAGLYAGYISGLERGLRNPTLAVVGQLAKGLGVSIADLFDRVDDLNGGTARVQKRGRPRR